MDCVDYSDAVMAEERSPAVKGDVGGKCASGSYLLLMGAAVSERCRPIQL